MLQNEGLDEKKKQYATCALDSTSPKEGEGGGGSRVGYVLAVSPSVTFYFEMIHFKCTIPAIGCTIPVLLCYADSWFDFGI